ncbi:RNA 2',3'-cyclic phosphodiesterase, partial [Haloferax sp. KTX1]|uniref:RNA 2',3'-cyclic phosphodiesterase n=1 Tax=Haloferax sp. KTX1 TaxID=2600597 RepID=UPI0011DE125C
MANRLFVSVDLDGLKDAIESVQERFDGVSGLRLTDPAQAHITLKFLGDTDPDRVDDIVTALEGAVEDSGVEPFEAEFGGLGVFPALSYISVVWVGVRDGQGGAELTALHEAVEART